MRMIEFALPVLVGTVTVHVAKGRRWSVVEHLLLDAVCRSPRTAEDLALSAQLPERMVVESFINLMRAGWIELRAEGRSSVFAATAGGRAVVDGDELPVVTRLTKRSVRYAVEQVGGSILRYRELDFIWAARFASLDDRDVRVIQPSAKLPEPRQAEVVASMLQEDEEFRGLVPNTARQGSGFALLSVNGQKVKGLPTGSSKQLRDAIIAASAALPRAGDEKVRLPPVPRASLAMPRRRATFSNDDLVLGGPAHRELLVGMIRAARSSVVVHSTFVGTGDYQSIVQEMIEAARDKGVRSDILWGKGDRPEQENTTRAACERINAEMRSAGLEQFIRAHAFSTGSHAKMIVADHGRGGWAAAVGSCNWLSSGFTSMEASVRLTDPLLVSDVMETLSQMAHRVTGLNGGVAARLAGTAVNIRRRTVPSLTKRGELKVILGPEHAEYVLAARDAARKRIDLGSHKLGRSARALALAPAAAAMRHGLEAAHLYYDELSEGVSREAAERLAEEYGVLGVSIVPIGEPRMHGKFLAWDDDDLLLTSQNLLSADPTDPYAEVGIVIKAPGVAHNFRERFICGLIPRQRA